MVHEREDIWTYSEPLNFGGANHPICFECGRLCLRQTLISFEYETMTCNNAEVSPIKMFTDEEVS